MASAANQRQIATARFRVGETPPPPEWGSPDDDTDPSITERLLPEPDPWRGPPEAELRWRPNHLAAVLAVLLILSIASSVLLALKLRKVRADLAEAEAAAEMAESALAQEEQSAGLRPVEPAPAGPQPAEARAPVRERLVLLLTVGTQHFAEKQLRALRKRCQAPLSVYRQVRGRCGWSSCFAVAVPAQDAEAARACGQVKGQALRDRADFVLP